MDCTLEACVETLEDSIRAERNGAQRIELCSSLECGGLTPDFTLVKKVIESVKIPVRVMIRPRIGDFFYSEKEFGKIRKEIQSFLELDIEGFVFGTLTKDNEVDFERTKDLIKLCSGRKTTFHKAIDETSKDTIIENSKRLIDIGIDNILSSGASLTALEGRDILNKMVEVTNNKVIVAGKVTYINLSEVVRTIPSSNYHGRNIVNLKK